MPPMKLVIKVLKLNQVDKRFFDLREFKNKPMVKKFSWYDFLPLNKNIAEFT